MAPKKRSAAQLDAASAGTKKIKANAAARLAARANDEQDEQMQVDGNGSGASVVHARDHVSLWPCLDCCSLWIA